MSLKRKITKAEFDKLSKDLQKEYTADGDDYVLDVEASDDDDDERDPENDPAELRRARDREKADAKKLKKELADANKKLATLEGGRDNKDKDIDKLEGEYKEKVAAAEAERDSIKEKSQNQIRSQMINAAANTLASEISTMPKLMAKEIRERLSVEFDDDGEPELIIRNAKGKASDMTLDQLKKEFVANKEFSAIIIASKASGGSAPRNGADQKPGGAGASEQSPTDLSKLSPKDLAKHLKAKKEAEAQ